MVRSRYITSLLFFIFLFGFIIVPPTPVRSQQENADDKAEQLKAWEFPDAERHRGGNVGTVFAADYATSKPFEDVWTYYANKLGYKEPYAPNLTFGTSKFSSESGQSQIQILNSSDDPAQGRSRRQNAMSSTLIRRGAGGNVTVFISRAKNEDKTYFTLIVDAK